jgi:hypothetical protein
MGVFVYWYGPSRTGTKSICLLVHMGSGHSIVGMGHDRLLRTRPFQHGSLRNYPTVGLCTMWYGTGMARAVCLLRTGPCQIKIWSVPINELALFVFRSMNDNAYNLTDLVQASLSSVLGHSLNESAVLVDVHGAFEVLAPSNGTASSPAAPESEVLGVGSLLSAIFISPCNLSDGLRSIDCES